MKISENGYRRLAIIKYIFTLAVEQSKIAEPIGSISILGFHDSIELFLQLACEHLDTGKNEPSFMQYWEIISKKKGEDLSHKEVMRRLNSARVAFKHHGNLPSKIDLDGFRAEVINFFEINSEKIFTVKFQTISLVDLVAFPYTKRVLKEAELRFQENKLELALQLSAKAFDILENEYERTSVTVSYNAPFHFDSRGYFKRLSARDFEFEALPDGRNRRLRSRMKEFVENVGTALSSIQENLKIMAMGVDNIKFLRFKKIVPKYVVTGDEEFHFVELRENEVARLKSEDVEFCINFILETAIKIQGPIR